MRWLITAFSVLVGVQICAAVKCECQVKAGTETIFSSDVGPFFGPSNTCDECNTKCEMEINQHTNNGDLNIVPMPDYQPQKLGSLICSYSTVPTFATTTIQVFSVCDGGQPQPTKFAIKNPDKMCCRNGVWPDGDPNQAEKC